jgi:hypothetical protein
MLQPPLPRNGPQPNRALQEPPAAPGSVGEPVSGPARTAFIRTRTGLSGALEATYARRLFVVIMAAKIKGQVTM